MQTGINFVRSCDYPVNVTVVLISLLNLCGSPLFYLVLTRRPLILFRRRCRYLSYLYVQGKR